MPVHAGWRFCPRCGREDLEITDGRAQCPNCGFSHYASASPTASALVEDDHGRILLARRANDPDKGLWDLPGGFLEEGEHPLDALKRELKEETGYDIEAGDFFDVVMDVYGESEDAVSTLNLYWRARVTGGDEEAADDVAELRWFGADELPRPDELAFSNNEQVLSAWRDENA